MTVRLPQSCKKSSCTRCPGRCARLRTTASLPTCSALVPLALTPAKVCWSICAGYICAFTIEYARHACIVLCTSVSAHSLIVNKGEFSGSSMFSSLECSHHKYASVGYHALRVGVSGHSHVRIHSEHGCLRVLCRVRGVQVTLGALSLSRRPLGSTYRRAS